MHFLQDTFFYSLVYDPQQKTLLADKGEIRVGSKFQAEVPSKFIEGNQSISALSWLFQLCLPDHPRLRDKIIFMGAYVESYSFYTKQACLYTFEYN